MLRWGGTVGVIVAFNVLMGILDRWAKEEILEKQRQKVLEEERKETHAEA